MEVSPAEWQPIESAPRDGSHIKILSISGHEDSVYWNGAFWDVTYHSPMGSSGAYRDEDIVGWKPA